MVLCTSPKGVLLLDFLMIFKGKTPLDVVLSTIAPCTSNVCKEAIFNGFVTSDSTTPFWEVIATLESTDKPFTFLTDKDEWETALAWVFWL